jgi:hypothetical protein
LQYFAKSVVEICEKEKSGVKSARYITMYRGGENFLNYRFSAGQK